MGIPLGRRSSDGAFSQWIIPFDRCWQHLDGDYRAGKQRFPQETVWTLGGGDRALEIATCLRVCRIAGERFVRFGRWRCDVGETRQKPVDGLASVLLREFDR